MALKIAVTLYLDRLTRFINLEGIGILDVDNYRSLSGSSTVENNVHFRTFCEQKKRDLSCKSFSSFERPWRDNRIELPYEFLKVIIVLTKSSHFSILNPFKLKKIIMFRFQYLHSAVGQLVYFQSKDGRSGVVFGFFANAPVTRSRF